MSREQNGIRRNGKQELYTFRKVSEQVTNDVYQERTISYVEVQYYAIVVPARAYNIHSNTHVAFRESGKETFGIVEIYIEKDTGLVKGDLLIADDGIYQISAKETHQTIDIYTARLVDVIENVDRFVTTGYAGV